MRPEEPSPPADPGDLPGAVPPGAPADGDDGRPGRRRGRRRRGRRGRGDDGPPEGAAAEGGGALTPEADAFEAPPLGAARPDVPTLLEPGAAPAVGPGAGGDPRGEGGGRRGGRRRGGRGRRGHARDDWRGPGGAGEAAGRPPPLPDEAMDPPPLDGGEVAPADAPPGDLVDLGAEAGADLPAPDPGAPGRPAESSRAGEPRRGEREGRRGRRTRDRRERDPVRSARRPERGERAERPERGERRPRHESDLPEVHEAPLPAVEEGEEPTLPPPSAPLVKTVLLNATDPEEVRIALLEDGKLEEIYIETGHERSAAGNVYRGRVQNVERGIGAAFVDLGRGLMGFLHATDLPDPPEEGKEDAPITERIQPGQELLVQITRDSIGRKGPALTGRIALPGRFLVLMPNSDRSGVSRRIGLGRERDRMRRLMTDLEVPEGMGLIVRTAGESQPLELLRADLKHLLLEWSRLQAGFAAVGQPGLLRGESDVAERCVRDILPADAAKLIVDDPAMAARIRTLLDTWYPQTLPSAEPVPSALPGGAAAPPGLEALAASALAAPPPAPGPGDEFAAGLLSPAEREAEAAAAALAPPPAPVVATPAAVPAHVAAAPGAVVSSGPVVSPGAAAGLPKPPALELWTDPMPLLHAQGVETQLEDALRRTSRLPSGGSIVVDPTEALVAIDVNSGRLTDEEDPEKTALVTNLEAVAEATRQLRLRDLGGLIVIDFIDMRDKKAIRQLERALRLALARDRARIRVDRVGPFGCVMLSRQRIRQALSRVTHEECGACAGTGRRRLLSGLALRVLREMQARVARSRGRGGLEVRAPLAVVEWIKKHRSAVLRDLKQVCTGPVRLEPDLRLAPDGWAMKGLAADGTALTTRPGSVAGSAAVPGPGKP